MKIADILTEAGLEDFARSSKKKFARPHDASPNTPNTDIMADAVKSARKAFQVSKLWQGQQERPYTWQEQLNFILHHIRNNSIHGPEGSEGAFYNNFPAAYINAYGPESRNAATASTGGATQDDIDSTRHAQQNIAGTNLTGQQALNSPAVDSYVQNNQGAAGEKARDSQQRKYNTKEYAAQDAIADANVRRDGQGFKQKDDGVAAAQAVAARGATGKAARNSDKHAATEAKHAELVASGAIGRDFTPEDDAPVTPHKVTKSHGPSGNLGHANKKARLAARNNPAGSSGI